MYNLFYNLNDRPFRLDPDLKYFYTSRPHKRAMAHMNAGLEQTDGVLVLTGDKGIGKTTLITHLLNRLDKNTNIVAFVKKSTQNDQNFLPAIMTSLHIPTSDQNPKAMFSLLQSFMIEQTQQNKKILLVIDDAENLSHNLLEFIRLLSALRLNDQGLIQIILVGTTELEETISNHKSQSFRQQIIMSYCMHPLKVTDIREYIEHRLKVAGWNGEESIIDEDAFSAIHQITEGIPYTINRYCDRLFMLGMLRKSSHISRNDVTNMTLETMKKLEQFEAEQMEQEKPVESVFDRSSMSNPEAIAETSSFSNLASNSEPKHAAPIKQEYQTEKSNQIQHEVKGIDMESDLDKIFTDTPPPKKSNSFFNKQTMITIGAVYLVSTLSFFAYGKFSEMNQDQGQHLASTNASHSENTHEPKVHGSHIPSKNKTHSEIYLLNEIPAETVAQVNLGSESAEVQLLDISLLLKKGHNLNAKVDIQQSNKSLASVASEDISGKLFSGLH